MLCRMYINFRLELVLILFHILQYSILSIIIAIIMVTFTFFGAVIIYEKLNDYFIYEIKNEIGDFNVNGYLIFNTRKKILLQ